MVPPHAIIVFATFAHLIERYGAIVIFISSFTEVIPPFSFFSPGIFILIIAGTLAPSAESLALFIAAAAAGVILGNMVLFRIGFWYGRSVAHRLHLTESRLKEVETFMQRYGRFNVFFGQFVGLVRPGVAFVAGMARMDVPTYYVWMVTSGIAWAAFYIELGALLHARVGLRIAGNIGIVLYIGGCVVILVQLALLHRNRKKSTRVSA